MSTGIPTPAHTENASTATSETDAFRFDAIVTAPDSRHRLIGGPNLGCASNQACNRGEDLAKANTAASMNGNVGSSGTATPINPNTKLNAPMTSQKIRTRTTF